MRRVGSGSFFVFTSVCAFIYTLDIENAQNVSLNCIMHKLFLSFQIRKEEANLHFLSRAAKPHDASQYCLFSIFFSFLFSSFHVNEWRFASRASNINRSHPKVHQRGVLSSQVNQQQLRNQQMMIISIMCTTYYYYDYSGPRERTIIHTHKHTNREWVKDEEGEPTNLEWNINDFFHRKNLKPSTHRHWTACSFPFTYTHICSQINNW